MCVIRGEIGEKKQLKDEDDIVRTRRTHTHTHALMHIHKHTHALQSTVLLPTSLMVKP